MTHKSALSRSDKRVLHLDPNDYYGDLEAALNLEDADAWVARQGGDGGSKLIANASTWTNSNANDAHGALRSARSYSLALAPQIIYTRSALLSQLVSSRAYRQVEFLAVGSFFVYEQPVTGDQRGTLSRIPSSREDVFSTQAIPARSKRSLMKFLKFVIEYDSEQQRPVWQEHASEMLARFLEEQFKLDDSLRRYILALTLTLDGKITVRDGLAIIHRHLSSLGWFGPGFCAVYPKWGGGSEIAQVACRAGAVGGGIYMLDTGMEKLPVDDAQPDMMSLKLSNGTTVQTSALVASQDEPAEGSLIIRRLVAVVDSTFANLFEVTVEGAPKPAVAVVSLAALESVSSLPVHMFVHSSDTGECPSGQSKFCYPFRVCCYSITPPPVFRGTGVFHDDQTIKNSYLHCLSFALTRKIIVRPDRKPSLHNPQRSMDPDDMFHMLINGFSQLRRRISYHTCHSRCAE